MLDPQEYREQRAKQRRRQNWIYIGIAVLIAGGGGLLIAFWDTIGTLLPF